MHPVYARDVTHACVHVFVNYHFLQEGTGGGGSGGGTAFTHDTTVQHTPYGLPQQHK